MRTEWEWIWHQMAPHSVILSSMPISGEPAKHVEFMRVKFPANIWENPKTSRTRPPHYCKYLWDDYWAVTLMVRFTLEYQISPFCDRPLRDIFDKDLCFNHMISRMLRHAFTWMFLYCSIKYTCQIKALSTRHKAVSSFLSKNTHMRGNATPWAAEHSRPISISSTSRQVAYRNCIRINMRVKHVTAVLRAYHCMLYHCL